jgi:hypothetical protein
MPISARAPANPRINKRGMSEDAVFDRGERMFNCASAQFHRFRREALLHPVESVFVQMAG